jgi:Undecaprenyl-phosphate galactose phosphotransferase WbaP
MQRLHTPTFLALSDVVFALLIWGAASVFRSVWMHGSLSNVTVASVVPTVMVWVGLRALLGMYPGYGLDYAEELRRHTYSVLALAAITAIFALGFQLGDLFSRLLLALGFMGLLLLVPLVRYLVKRHMRRVGWWGKPVMVVGSGETKAHITNHLRERWELGYNPVAIFDCRLTPTGGLRGGASCVEALAGATDVARKRRVDTVIFAMPHTSREQLAELVCWASMGFRHVLIMLDLAGVTSSEVLARNLVGNIAVEIRYNLLNPWTLRAKRALDLAATIVGGVLACPLLLVLSLLVYLESGGPVFYRDRRMGRDGTSFSCIKFRTMVPEAETALLRLLEEDAEANEEYLKYHKLRNDPRVTRIGRFLRKTSLDELPQLWNVLRGDMSLVGPRPYLIRESKEVGAAQSEILRVPPGMTGPWQVAGRNHASFGERVRMDAYYVRDWSIWLDLVILARTAKCVVSGRGAW